jgi:uncharacterized protein
VRGRTPSERTRVRRLPERGAYEREQIDAILDAGLVCHLGFVHDGVTVTLVDGLVLARSIFHHSINYRSVVVLGRAAEVVDPDEKLRALEAFGERILTGRWAEVHPPTRRELKATSILRLPLDEASAKLREGLPSDEEEDHDLPVWAGVIPLALRAGEPQPDPWLAFDLDAPAVPQPYGDPQTP